MPLARLAILVSRRAPMVGIAGAAAGVLALTLATAAPLQAQTDRRALSGTDVAVYNLAGRMTIERGTGTDVEVEVVRGGRDGDRLRIETSTVRGRASLRVIYPDDDIVYPGQSRASRWNSTTEVRLRDDGTWGGGGSWREGRKVRIKSRGDGVEAWADVRIRVPAGRDLAAYLAVGELTATDVNASLRLDVASARVAATGTRGMLDVDAGSGGVTLRNVSVSDLRIDNGSGGVSMTGVRGDRCVVDTGSGGVTADELDCAALQTDVGSGGVRIDRLTSNDLRVDAGSGSVRLGLRNSPKSVQVEAGSGGVTMELPSDFGATLDVETGSGTISTDFPVTTNRVSRNALRGTIGDGGGRVRIETGSGGVRLLKLMSTR